MFVGLHVLASFLPSADFIKCFRAKHGKWVHFQREILQAWVIFLGFHINQGQSHPKLNVTFCLRFAPARPCGAGFAGVLGCVWQTLIGERFQNGWCA